MLNPFPELLTYSLFAPLLLRVLLGLIFLDLGFLKLTKEKRDWQKSFSALGLGSSKFLVIIVGAIELAAGVLLILGLHTQIGAIGAALLTGIEAYLEWKDSNFLKRDFVFYLLLFVIALSLLMTGAGQFAFDIPL